MSYLPPIEYGVAKPARGIDGFGSDAASAASKCLLTSRSEYGWADSSAVAGAVCLCPAWISRAVKKKPTAEPMNGMMNFNKWIFSAASACTPIQKHTPMHIGMITKSTRRNLYTNSRTPIFMVANRLNIAQHPCNH